MPEISGLHRALVVAYNFDEVGFGDNHEEQSGVVVGVVGLDFYSDRSNQAGSDCAEVAARERPQDRERTAPAPSNFTRSG
jgi:hypothetical protein